jgi:hypothetical protein
MICFSREDIEQIGESVLRTYAKRSAIKNEFPLNIDWFARYHLGLRLEYRKLSDHGNLLGITTYKGIMLEFPLENGSVKISVPEDTILLDDCLRHKDNEMRRRFTVAHECAHQILAKIEEKRTGSSFRKDIVSGKQYSCRDLNAAEDWSEWQANTLGAVLLMPRSEIPSHLSSIHSIQKLTIYGDRFNSIGFDIIKKMADIFEVSQTAMRIRLQETGLVIRKPESEFFDIDIYAD